MALGVALLAADRSSSRQQLPEEVASYVRSLIMSGAVRPGEFLRMDRIAEAVGVSNTPVREGLLALRSEGFVRQVPRRGFIVEPFTRQDIRDIFWAQAVLASELAGRAAKNSTPELVARLEELQQQYDAAHEAGSIDAVARVGHAFHREINLAADSNRLARLLGVVVKYLPNRFYGAIEGHVDDTHDQHLRLVEAMRKRNAKLARTTMERHILNGAERVIYALEQQDLWVDETS